MKKTCTAKEAIQEVNKKRPFKHIYFRVAINPFLPVGDGQKGFPGYTTVKVTKANFIQAIKDSLKYLEERGARIVLTIPEKEFESFYIG